MTNTWPLICPRSTRSSNAVGQGPQARRRILPVQPQVQCEVIAGTRADHHERQVVLGGHLGHQRLRAVASGHAQQVRAMSDGLTSHLGHVDWLGSADEEHLGAQIFGLADQVELLHLPAAGLRVHDQVRVPGGWLRRALGHLPVRLIPGQRQPRGHAGEQPACGQDRRFGQQVLDRVDHDHRDRGQHEDRERHPAQHAPPGQEDVGGSQAHRHADHAHRQQRQALQPGQHHDGHDCQGQQQETQARQPALRARALRVRRRRHGWHRHTARPSSRRR